MEHASEEQIEKLYSVLLERLDDEQMAEATASLSGPEKELDDVCGTFDGKLKDHEKEMQAAVQEYERTLRLVSLMESQKGGLDDESDIEGARIQSSDAMALMEECLSRQADISMAYAEAKSAAVQKRLSAIRAVLERFGSVLQEAPPPKQREPLPNSEEPSSQEPASATPPAVTPTAPPAGQLPPTPSGAESEYGRYEALRAEHADLVIRVPAGFKQLGIEVDKSGVITAAPGGLFDTDYRVLAVDGKRFTPGLTDEPGAHSVILRCSKAQVLASLARLPTKHTRSKALKLLQVQVSPGGGGFGIDLSEFNSVASLVKGGAAEKSDLRPGDVIVGVDGVYTADRRLVEVLQRGRKSYIFNVVRPATLTPQDKPEEPRECVADTEGTGSVGKGQVEVATNSLAATTESAPAGQPSEVSTEDALKRSLAESLGRLQTQNEQLSAPTVQLVKIMPTDGVAITVEWATRFGAPPASRYHLEWKLQNEDAWSNSEASRNLNATVVTKGNLRPDGAYQFRVRAKGAESGEWGPWCAPSAPVRPDSCSAPDQLSTIAEETSEVSGAAPSGVTPSEPSALRANVNPSSVQALLLDQRQALEAEHALKLAGVKARFAEELTVTQDELADWKAQFAEAAGNNIQAVIDAKAATRKEVLQELEEERKALDALRDEAAQAVERIRAAERVAQDAKAEADMYKARFDKAFEEAKEQTDKEAQIQVNHVMRNAALELRDKVKFVEQQTDATVKRAVDEAVRQAEAKAEITRREALREMAAAHERQKELMGAAVGASAKQKIADVQEQQQSRVAYAVQKAVAEANENSEKRELAAVQAAVEAAKAELETLYQARQAAIEQQLLATTKEMETRMSAMYTEEATRVLVAKAREEVLKDKNTAMEEAMALAQKKAEVQLAKMSESIAERVREAVQARETELLADGGRKLRELHNAELREQARDVRIAGQQASREWGAGNDEFEEQALIKTRPTTLFGPDELLDAIPAQKKTPSQLEGAKPAKPDKTAAREADEESMVAPPIEVVRLRAKHAAEMKALLSRQEADELMQPEVDDGASMVDGRAKRAAEREELRKKQVAEAMAAGAALVYEESAKLALEDRLPTVDDTSKLLETMQIPTDRELSGLVSKNPQLETALARVRDMEAKLRALESTEKASGGAASDRKRSADEVQGMVSDGSRAGTRITDSERSSLRTALDLLRGSQQCGRDMQDMLSKLPSSASRAVGDTVSCVQADLSRDERVNVALGDRLDALLASDASGKLSEDESVLLRDLAEQLRKQLQQAEAREAQISWLRAESRSARIAELIDARGKLDQLHADAIKASRTVLPMTPVAVSESTGSIAVDWVPPTSCPAATFHLQWREQGETQWTSSKASEQIKVPCCTKGQLKLSKLYEFRVRAADPDGRWGPWSEPTVAIAPVPPSRHLPSRPKMRALSKGCLQARWQAPTDGETQIVQYELQWRQSQMDWGEVDESLQTSDAVASTTPLQVGVHYLFRVRAMVEHPKRGKIWTPFGPPSVPIQPVASKTSAKAKEGSRTDADIPSLPDIPIPVRNSTADDGETVIAAQIREVAQMSTNPDVQAVARRSLEEMADKKKEDAANLLVLEQRHKALVARSREEQLNELVAMKQMQLAAQMTDGNGHIEENGSVPSANYATDTWD